MKLNYYFAVDAQKRHLLKRSSLKKLITVILMLFSFFLFSQQTKAIYGIVFSKKDKKPLAGASIQIVTSNAQKKNPLATGKTLTNKEGLFNLTLPLEVSRIIISLPGYKNLTLPLKKNKEYYAMYLTEDETIKIGQVYVNGYQKISKERATGSYLNVDLKTFKQQRTATNLIELLKGQVPEMLFKNTNPNSLVLRGSNSFYGDDFPLVILDGFELNGLSIKTDVNDMSYGRVDAYDILNKINIDNIESVFVLKDAAAASIWGARASNGVIVITTKKGKKSRPLFSYHSSFSFQPATDYHYYRKNKGSIDDVIEIARLMVENNLNLNHYSPYSAAVANPAAVQAFLDLKEGRITQAECDRRINQMRGKDALSEYRHLFIRNASTQNHTISLLQGSDNSSFYASFGYLREEPGIKEQQNERYNALLNLSSQPFKGVNFSGGINFSRERYGGNQNTSFFDFWNAYDKILDDQGKYVNYPFFEPQTQKQYEQSKIPYPYDFTYNIKRDFDYSHIVRKSLNVDLHAKLEINLLKGLTGTLQYQFQRGNVQGETLYQEGNSTLDKKINGSAIFVSPGGPLADRVFDPSKGYNGFAIPKGDELVLNRTFSNSSGMNVLINYSGYLTQNQAHYINILAGASFSEKNFVTDPAQELYGYDPTTLTSQVLFYGFRNKYGYKINNVNSSKATHLKDRYLSDFININYTYQNKYVLTGSARLDDSNLFGSSRKYRNIPLWSTGIKWIMIKENFMQSIKFLNLLNLRATYGSTGKINKTSNPYLTLSETVDPTLYIHTASIAHAENPELRWEKTTTANLGLDFQLFNHRLGGSIEFYRKYSSDILYNSPINPTYGYTSQTLNYAAISNCGFEITGYYALALSHNLGYRIQVGLNYNKNKVERVDEKKYTIDKLILNGIPMEGRPLGALWAYQYAGLSPEGKPQIYDAQGNIIDEDTDMDDIAGLKYAGQTTPKYYGNFSHTLSYKGISLHLLFSYQLGYVFRRYNSVDYRSHIMRNNQGLPSIDWQRRWKKPGDELLTAVPAFLPKEIYNSNYNNYYTESTALIEKGDHIRWESISLNYTVNKKWLKNTFIKKLQCGVDIQNLGVIYAANSYHEDPLLLSSMNPIKPKPIYSLNLYVNF